MSIQFQELLLTQLPRLRAYAMTLTRNPADAADLVQTAAERVLKYESHFEVGTNFSAWAYKILRNSHISNCRKYKQQVVSLEQVSGESTPHASLITPARQEDYVFTHQIVRAMDQLPAHLRETMVLICSAQLSYEEAAIILSCSVGTVKSRLWRARAQMKNLLLGTDEATFSEFGHTEPSIRVDAGPGTLAA